MKRGVHKIRITVEIIGDGFSTRIPSALHEIPAPMPIGRAARFALQDCLESKTLREWTFDQPEKGHHD